MREQLETLAAEAASLLLFLRNVECCEVLVWPHGAAQPQLLHSCTVQVSHGSPYSPSSWLAHCSFICVENCMHSNCGMFHVSTHIQGAGPDFRRQRALFQEAGSSSAILAVHQLTLQTTDHSTQQSVEHAFLVGQSNGGGRDGPLAAFAARAAQALGAPLVPWGAVAAPLTTPGKLGCEYWYLLHNVLYTDGRKYALKYDGALLPYWKRFTDRLRPLILIVCRALPCEPFQRRPWRRASILLPAAASEDRPTGGAHQRLVRVVQVSSTTLLFCHEAILPC